jgi:hypothetical protein
MKENPELTFEKRKTSPLSGTSAEFHFIPSAKKSLIEYGAWKAVYNVCDISAIFTKNFR